MNQAKDLFDQYFKHDMLSLAADRVVNVRIAVARALKNHFRTINCTFMHDPLVNQAVKVLLTDKSQDVLDLVQDIVLVIIGVATKTLMVGSVRLIAQAAQVLFTYR